MRFANNFAVAAILVGLGFGYTAHAEETKMERAETAKDKTVDASKATYRDAKGKLCEMVNGKLDCAVKKVQSKLKTAADKAKTKATEAKNKAD